LKIKKNYITFSFFFILIVLTSCKETKNNDISENTSDNDNKVLTIQKDENKNRAVWQKPETVISLMGDLKGKKVADIGAGTGYFTFRIALKAKKVIAIDIVKSYLDILENLKQKLPDQYQGKIETRLGKPNDPLLKNKEVDIVVIINTFSFIKYKKQYLKTILSGLNPDGKIFIVDFKMKNLPIDAPKKSMRLPMYKLEELLSFSGYKSIKSDDTTLDYQYIVIAEKN